MKAHSILPVLILVLNMSCEILVADDGEKTKSTEQPTESSSVLEPYREAAIEKWEQAILQLEKKDATEAHSDSSVLFIGSSSIRLWKTIVEDIAPYHPIQRGYGGARFSDVAVYAERLIQPHQYRALVVFVANDIQGKDTDHTVDEVASLVRHIMDVSRQHQPKAPILFIEITPTASRFAAWPEIRRLNARLRDIALATPHTYFIPTAQHYLHPDATPRDELFVDDKLHLNREGYSIWANLVRRRLDEVLRLETMTRVKQAAQKEPASGSP